MRKIGIVLFCICCMLVLSRYIYGTLFNHSEKKPTMFPKSFTSPQQLTTAVYPYYFSCMKTIPNPKIPLFTQCIPNGSYIFDASYLNTAKSAIDPLFCGEGIPQTIHVMSPYMESATSATVIIDTVFPGGDYHIPVRLHSTAKGWVIYAIDCDLDGHID